STTNTRDEGSSTTVATAPSQVGSSPHKVRRQTASHPVPANGECGARVLICSGCMFVPYAAARGTGSAVVVSSGLSRSSRGAAGSTTVYVGGATGRPGGPSHPARTIVSRGGPVTKRIIIIGGGPAGYEAALVAAQHGADVTVVDAEGIGGNCVLTDCVPSK